MAMLVNELNGQVTILLPVHTFGRNPLNTNTHINKPDVSGLHGQIVWRDEQWYIKDLSRNGIWLNGIKIKQGQWFPLQLKHELIFSSLPKKEVWKITDLSPPQSGLYSPDTKTFLPLETYNLLPNQDKPECVIFCKHNSHGIAQWFKQDKNEPLYDIYEPLEHGKVLQVGDTVYQLHLNTHIKATMDKSDKNQSSLKDVKMKFEVSQNEENINVTFVNGDYQTCMNDKTHNYLLLCLARQQKIDQQANKPSGYSGWINNAWLWNDLKIEENYFNIQIFRARQCIAECLHYIYDYEKLIERRRGSVRLNLPASNIEILTFNRQIDNDGIGQRNLQLNHTLSNSTLRESN